MIASRQAAPPPPGTIRDRAHEILGRAEFEQHKSVLQRVLEWISDQLNRFSFGIGSGPGFVGDLIGLLFIAGAVVLVVLLVRSLRRRPRKSDEEAELTVEEEARRSAKQWRTDAERFEAEQRWRDAMRARYRELIRMLVDERVLVDVPGRTTGEYRVELADAHPAASSDFDDLTELFESAWYGGRPTGAAENQRFRELAGHVRRLAADHREPVSADAP